MKDIEYGLKLWSKNSDYKLICEAKNLIDSGIFSYIELMPVPGSDISVFLKEKLPYIIHIPHDKFGFNIGNKEKKENNLELLNESIDWANNLSAKYLILHPGFGDMAAAIDFLKEINDKRILIENMPAIGINGEKMIGSDVLQIKELMGDKFGFCLDFSHAIKTALRLNRDYKEYIKEFLGLQPEVFHVSDGRLLPKGDEHLKIGEGQYDFNFLLDCVKSNESKLATLETFRNNLDSLDECLEDIKKLNIKNL